MNAAFLFLNLLPVINSTILVVSLFYFVIRRLREKHAKGLVTSFYGSDLDVTINSKLSQIRFQYDADKAKIFLFHNGGVFLHGHSMKKMSLSYLQVKPGILPPTISRLQNLPTSLFPNMMTRFLEQKNEVIVWATQDAPDNFIRTRFTEEGVTTVIVTSLWSKQNNLIGFMSLNFLRENQALNCNRSDLLKYAEEIGALLDSF